MWPSGWTEPLPLEDDPEPDPVVCGVEALLRTTEEPADPPDGTGCSEWVAAGGFGPEPEPPKVVKAVRLGDEWPMGISGIPMGLSIISGWPLPVWMAMGEVRDE